MTDQLDLDGLEASTRAYGWMVAHDMLKAGKPYDLPSPADVPANLARALAAEADAARVSALARHLIHWITHEVGAELPFSESDTALAETAATLTQRGA